MSDLSQYTTQELKQEIRRRRSIAPNDPLIKTTFEVVCKHYNVKMTDIMDSKRNSGTYAVKDAKRILYYLFHKNQKRSVMEVARIMNKNHSTITVLSNKVKEEMKVNPKYDAEIKLLIRRTQMT